MRTRLEANSTYVWICCLCVNQHRVKELASQGRTVPFEEFENTFGTRVRGIGHILCMMTPWDAPVYLTRVWCIFEVFTGIRQGLPVDFIMPPDQSSNLQAMLMDPKQSAMQRIFKAMAHVSIKDADASVQDDKDNILSLISRDGESAIDELNASVRNRLQKWVVDTLGTFRRTKTY